jgi:ribosomal-protein-alanine N-acetyltransferase
MIGSNIEIAMSAEVSIQTMTGEDLSAVLDIERGSFADPWPEEVFEAEMRHSWSQCLVLNKSSNDGRPIGYVIFWSVADEVHLLNLAVDPGERHHHYGLILMDHMVEYAREKGARFITLEVRRSNEAAVSLYERGGFKQVGVRPKYYANNGEDALLMLYDLGSDTGVFQRPKTLKREQS